MNNWTEKSKLSFFNIIDKSYYENNMINCSKVTCKPSNIVKGQKGVFANDKILKGDIIEWGVATIIDGINVQNNDIFYTWSLIDRTKAATVSGCGLFYNTLGDKSNARCVPYHSENRFEVYALRDIDKNEEITFRYDSMNYRKGMNHLIDIVGYLEDGDVCL